MKIAFEIFKDWRVWLVIASLLKDFVIVVGVFFVKFNDLKHLGKDIGGIKKKIDKIFIRLGKVERTQIKRDAICEERSKQIDKRLNGKK